MVAKESDMTETMPHTGALVLRRFLLYSEVYQLCVDVQLLSWVLLLRPPWFAACQTLSSTCFSGSLLLKFGTTGQRGYLTISSSTFSFAFNVQFSQHQWCIYPIYPLISWTTFPQSRLTPPLMSLKGTRLSSLQLNSELILCGPEVHFWTYTWKTMIPKTKRIPIFIVALMCTLPRASLKLS